jgi:hypothetical protein
MAFSTISSQRWWLLVCWFVGAFPCCAPRLLPGIIICIHNSYFILANALVSVRITTPLPASPFRENHNFGWSYGIGSSFFHYHQNFNRIILQQTDAIIHSRENTWQSAFQAKNIQRSRRRRYSVRWHAQFPSEIGIG